MSPLEVAAFALGVANVTLVVRRSVWNYPFALAMVSLYAVVFFEAKLYSDALLQGFFFAVNVYGWWAWARVKGELGEVRVELMRPAQRWAWVAGTALATAIWGFLMHRYTDAAFPWWDAGVAMASVASQVVMTRRYLENWIGWIVVDAAAISLYAARDLWLTALLYAVFLALSIWGLLDWRRAFRTS